MAKKLSKILSQSSTGLPNPCGICDSYCRGAGYYFENQGRQGGISREIRKGQKDVFGNAKKKKKPA